MDILSSGIDLNMGEEQESIRDRCLTYTTINYFQGMDLAEQGAKRMTVSVYNKMTPLANSLFWYRTAMFVKS